MVAIRSFTSDERLILEAYFSGNEDWEHTEACDRLGVPDVQNIDRIDAAVGQVLVQSFQKRLPNYAICNSDKMVLGRRHRKRTDQAILSLIPQHLFTINWADSAPGVCWPEAYHVVFVPGYDRHVVVASQDGTDAYGCTDQARGYFDAKAPLLEAAGEVLRAYWRRALDEYDQGPWAYLFDEGLVDRALAEAWRAMVWESAQAEGANA